MVLSLATVAERMVWRWLRFVAIGLAAIAVGLADLYFIAILAQVWLMPGRAERIEPEDVPYPSCLAADGLLFDDFRKYMANSLSPFDLRHSPREVVWKESSAASFFAMLASGEAFTPGGHVYREPAAFVTRFKGELDTFGDESCDFVGAIADARNWRPATVADAERRRIVHAAEGIAKIVRALEWELHRLPGDGLDESKSVDIRIESKGEMFAVGRVTVTNTLEGTIQGEGLAARLDGRLTRVRMFEPAFTSPSAAWETFRARAELELPYRLAEFRRPPHLAKTTADTVPWTFLDDVWVMPAR